MTTAITNDTQALLTGMIMGHLIREHAKYKAGDPALAVTNVVPDVDGDGNYLPTMTVSFASGTNLRVSVLEMTEVIEE